MKKSARAAISLIAVLTFTTSILSSCSSTPTPAAAQATATTTAEQVISASAQTALPMPTLAETEAPTPKATPTTAPVATLDETQRNSINMLNWLAFLTQEINTESNNRVFIEDVYSLIVNETYPNAVDTHTQDRLKGIRQALVRYRMVDVKRERIEFLFEQNRAQAIKAAIPNPLTLMTSVQSASLARLAASVVYMAINSVSSYQSTTAQTELQYLQDGWTLSDEAQEVFYNLRSDAFDYMIDIVRAYKLPGDLALNEKAIEEFVSWKSKPDLDRRILFLESNVDTYQAFGSYWLALAESYYAAGSYAKCLEAIRAYEALSTRIFRRDIEYAKVLPLAIVAAENVLPEQEANALAAQYAAAMLENIGTEDWALRYYAAQTYVSLYARTQDAAHLWDAYYAVLNNVNYLVDEQLSMNDTYIAKVKEEPIPAGTSKEKEKQIKDYNRLLQEKRKTELPPVSEPLLLNCDLLFAVANQLGIPDSEQDRIDHILHANNNALFLIDALDQQCWMKGENRAVDLSIPTSISFSGKELTLPVEYTSDEAEITVTTTNPDGKETVFTDWKVAAVNRATENELATYAATFRSADAEKYAYVAGTQVRVSIVPHREYATTPITFSFEAMDNKPNWYDHIGFWNSDLVFRQVD